MTETDTTTTVPYSPVDQPHNRRTKPETIMNTISISRRRFAHLIGAGLAAAALRPALSFSAEEIAAPASSGIVRLSSNENPYGPSPKALRAMTEAFSVACRY